MAWLAEIQVYKAINRSPRTCKAVGVCNTNTVAENVSSLHPTHLLPALAGSRQRPRSEPSPNMTQVSNCHCQCGPQGPPGPPGRDGRDGISGPIGAPGAPGNDGRDSEMGPPGSDGRDGDMGTPGRDGRDGSPGRDGLPGPSGASGRDGRDGAVGPPGHSAGMDLEEIRNIIKLVAKEEYRTHSYPPVASCPGWSIDRPATSCHSILDCNPSIPSGYYWITNGARPHIMYCYMEADKCGMRGVMRVAHIDMRISSVNCPAPLTQYQLDSGERVCGSTNSASQSCDSVIFPTHHISYQYVCGRAAGFSYHDPCAFYYYKNRGQNTTDHAYVSGLSITYGPQNGRNHIWTYAGGYQESVLHPCNCPCAANPGVSSPPFVGQDLYCESATRYPPPSPQRWYTNNTLWDGEDCYPGSSCCDNPLAP